MPRFLIALTMILNWCAFYFGYQLVRDHNSTEVRALRAESEALRHELDALENYLMIQGVRLGDGLETRIDCDCDVRGVPVPAVMVQPLVENAIKYGGQTGPQPICVHVTARREGEWLGLEMANTSRWVRVVIRIPEPGVPIDQVTGVARGGSV